ncbi:hypothetical protein Tco_0529981 [Tanacetum coccineum]
MTFINANVLSNFVSLQCLSSLLNALLQNTMAEQNVPAQPPTRTDEQIVPRSQWLTIGKSNLLFNAQKIQKNPIFQISVDILSNTNFFQALTASANVPAIYLQQFWKTMSYNEKTGVYSCQLDEQWFDLSADLLRKALAITPVNPAHPFELPPSGDTVIDFVNELGYPEPVEIVSSIRTNYVYQPWRAILSLLNQCLTGKTSGSDKPRHPVLQMLWGIVTQTNVDHAELIWEEFTQGIQIFSSHKASHKASLKNPKKKVTPLLIPYGRFSKVIIYYLASNNNIHRRPDSAVHHTGDDYIFGNLRSDPESEHSEQSSDDISKQDEGNDSDIENTNNAHIPKVSTTTWFKPIPESERPATPEPEWTIPPNDFPEPEHNWANAYATTFKVPEENKLQRKTYDIGSFIKWFCRRTGKKKLCKADLEGPAFNLVKAFHKNSVFLQYQMDECHKLLTNKVDLSNPEGHQIPQNINEPLPLGGPPGQVTIQPQFFFNKDLDYLLTGDKERKIALSISKLKAARYLDFGLEELVPSLWVESEREYDISAVYGITHWWFRRKEFYINKHSESSDREAVRSQMRILSVISVKVFEKYGYNYLIEIILRRADYQEYKISEKDFKNLHPNDFEDLFLLNIQEKLNHLPKTDKISLHTAVNMWIRNLVIRNRVGDLQLKIESYQTKINLERPNWDAAD